ncbi:aminopeptidase [Membranicola marinus]|uniref:Aminopeptidase n=1 Tax=Membranihabitans marinus TaxID=1227546 RepID=A0A953L8F0_9BACT|nr:aminopeptidase [Membranihabitans marinus]MBY5957615.1 aminopeptidase [Membranihabitans marinus]
MESKYAELLLNYCLEVKKGDRLFVQSTFLAEPLLKEIYRIGTRLGALVEFDLALEGQSKIFFDEADDELLRMVSPVQEYRYRHYDKYLSIRAPYNLSEDKSISGAKLKIRKQALQPIHTLYFQRTADQTMDRCLCQYPTQAAAQAAEMSLDEYRQFVFQACRLYDANPTESWLKVRKNQQRVTDLLNRSEFIQYQGPHIDLSFSCKGRPWINSDGRANMPSGEIFTAPVDDSTQGTVYFTHPAIYRGQEVSGISLTFEDGYITAWSAEKGQAVLDDVFEIEGARRLGEAAIGNNYQIQQMTKNILFDEKIGGTIHLAVGQAYLQNNGINKSSIHWDMITDMSTDSRILADGKTIYENGHFIIQ